jgi:sugar/nucleoside kinase (ribokinase family)
MPITVVGSVAFDAVRTPFASSERMLGGAAVHFALAASFFDSVAIVGCVGDDFGEGELQVLRERGIAVGDIERVRGGQTFFWRGEYGYDLATRTTLETRLGVFADFQPRLSVQSRSADVLFLANIQPGLQRAVRAQMPDARFVALDSMNLWIQTAQEELLAAIGEVDCVILNDSELRELTRCASLPAAAAEVLALGPRAVVAKQGEYGASLFTADGFFSLPAYPLEQVVDPTGAGDTFAGGFIGYLAAHREREIDEGQLRAALACGSALASFNVEELGTERLQRLRGEEIAERIAALERFTSFSVASLPLRAQRPQEASAMGTPAST